MPEKESFQVCFAEVSFDTSEQNQLSYFLYGLYRDMICIPHVKGLGMIILQYEIRICQKMYNIHNLFKSGTNVTLPLK